jgi:superfamily II DNA or RNA helicase
MLMPAIQPRRAGGIPVAIRTLRPYQADAFRFICDQCDDVCIELPTGAGKTLIICAAVARLLRSGITHAVIAAPQLHVEHTFAEHGVTAAAVGGDRIELPADLIRSLDARQRTEAVLRYLGRKSPGYAVACTHQTLIQVMADRLPPALKNCLLVIDEAHHAPSEGLGAFVAAWRKRGGRLLFATATPYRQDWEPVVLERMKLFRRSLAEHMQDGDGEFAPRELVNEMVALDAGRDVIAAEFAGEEMPPGRVQDLLVAQMVAKWLADGRPRTIVRVPPLAGGSATLVRKLVKGFRAAGAREVYDATGVSKERQRDFLQFLQEQRQAGYEATADVVIGIQRVVEGTDWPVCSNVYLIGLPGSLQAVVQALGRAMRKKGNDHPKAFRSKAKIVFFVLANRGQTLARLPLEHSRRALFLAAFLADCRAGLEWAVDQDLQGVVAGLADRLVSPGDRAGQDGQPDRITGDSPLRQVPLQYRAAALQVAAQVFDDARRERKQLTLDELKEVILRHQLVQEIPEEDRFDVVPKVLTELLLQQDGRRRVRDSMRRHAARLWGAGAVPLPQLTDAVLRAVVEEFRKETITEARVLEALRTQLHQLTGGDMRAFTDRLTEAVHLPIGLADVHAAILEYHDRTDSWPSTVSGYCERLGLDFRQLDHYLRQGFRGLGPDSSLYREIKAVAAAHRLRQPDRDYDPTPLTEAQVQEAIRQHFESQGDTPACEPTLSPLGMNWDILDRYLRKGGRGLGPGSSLAKQVVLFRRSRGLPVKEKAAPLTYPDLHLAIQAYAQEHGKRPTRNSPGKVPVVGISWLALENLLKRGGRGLGRESTVAKEVAAALAAVLVREQPKYSLDGVRGAIRDHFERTGNPPSSHTPGSVPSLGVSWMTLAKWLRRDGTSLTEEVHRTLGALPNPNRLTLEQVQAALLEYHRLHGGFPRRDTAGEVPLIGGSWGTLNNNLVKGGRGLGKGSSLAQEVRKAAGRLQM